MHTPAFATSLYVNYTPSFNSAFAEQGSYEIYPSDVWRAGNIGISD